MLEAVNVKTQNLVSRLSKLIAVATPALGPEFLEEVHIKPVAKRTLNFFIYHHYEFPCLSCFDRFRSIGMQIRPLR
jgi:hypothetical protein